MKITSANRRRFGGLHLEAPPIVFGTAALGNMRKVIPLERKLAICGEWFRHVGPPVFIEAVYSHGDGLALEVLERMLRRLDVASGEVIINLTLDWTHSQETDLRIGRELILECLDRSFRLLGDEYRPRLASIGNVDDYLAAARSAADREQRLQGVVNGYEVLAGLKASGMLAGLGVMAKDWRVASELVAAVHADWVTLTSCFTLLHHSQDVFAFMAGLAERQLPIILSGVFSGGFLVGGNQLDGRIMDANDPASGSWFAWRKAFAALCHGHGVRPAHACIQFALSAPGVVAVELNSSYPDRVAENVEAVMKKVPAAFWASMKEEGLLGADYRCDT